MITSEITEEEAIRIYDTKEYEGWTDHEKVSAMLYGQRLCMPFEVFHESIERVLGRPVFTHEFGLNFDGIVREFEGAKEAPTIEEIINLIPSEKRVIAVYAEKPKRRNG